MHISQRNIGPDDAKVEPHVAPLTRRGFVAGVGAGLGLGILAMTTIGASSAAAATHRYHCSQNTIYIRQGSCWCISPDYFCNFKKWCNMCLGTCGSFTEIVGCC